MEISVSRNSQRSLAIRWSVAVVATAGLAIAGLAVAVGHSASGTHAPSVRPAIQAPSEPPLSGDCMNAPQVNGLTLTC